MGVQPEVSGGQSYWREKAALKVSRGQSQDWEAEMESRETSVKTKLQLLCHKVNNIWLIIWVIIDRLSDHWCVRGIQWPSQKPNALRWFWTRFLPVTTSKSTDLRCPCLSGVTQHRQTKQAGQAPPAPDEPLLSSSGASSPLRLGHSTQHCQGWGGQPAFCPCWVCGSGCVGPGGAWAVSCMVPPVRAGSRVSCVLRGGRAGTGAVAARPCLPHRNSLTCPAPQERPFIFPISKCTFTPPTEAGWAKIKVQPAAGTPAFKCDVLQLN